MRDLIIITIIFSLLFWVTARTAYLKGIETQLAGQDLNVVWKGECEAVGGRWLVIHAFRNKKILQCVLIFREGRIK